MNGERGVGNFLKDNVCKEAANVASFLENNTSIYWSDPKKNITKSNSLI